MDKQNIDTRLQRLQLLSQSERDAWISMVVELAEHEGLSEERLMDAFQERVRFYLHEGFLTATTNASRETKAKLSRLHDEEDLGEFPTSEPAGLFED